MSPEATAFAALAADLMRRPARLGGTRLVCVDGPAGSGKTTFAGTLAAALARDGALVHMDDLYAGWTLTGARARLAAAVLGPLARGEPAGYRCFDWVAGRFADEVTPVRRAAVLVVEGCGSCAPDFDRWTALRVWVEAPRELRLARGLARDGAALEPQWRRWQRMEAALFAAEHTRTRAELLADGSDGAPGAFLPLARPDTGPRRPLRR